MSNQLANLEATWRPQLNAYFERQLPNDVTQPRLEASMQYSLLAGGKRLRPLLTIAVLESAGIKVDETFLKPIGAIELLHTYSLIHDDLPAMDNDDLRRGVPTNHVKFDPATATLAGDGLLTLAFQWLTDNQLEASIQSRLVRLLSIAAGPAGMVAGQMADVQGEQQHLNLSELKQLHREKTGAIITYAVEAGALMAKLDQQTRDALRQFAQAFGLAFQIYDDILDETATTKELGKLTHKDSQEHKNTYPGLLGLTGANHELKKVIETGKQSLLVIETFDVSLLNSFFDYFKVEA